MKRLKVTRQAKKRAAMALKLREGLPKSMRFGLTKTQARQLGINSGIERARQLIRSESISFKDAMDVCRFRRFSKRKKKTLGVKGVIDLWGGSGFIERACRFVESERKEGGV